MTDLRCGDCLELMKDIPDKSIDMILADPPYGVTKCKWDSVIPLDRMWDELNRIIKPDGAILLFGSGLFTAECMTANRKWWRYNLIWEKTTPTGFLNAKRMPLRSHEDIMVFYQKLPKYNPQKTTGHPRKVSTAEHKRNSKKTEDYGSHGLTTYDSTERYPTSVLKFKSDKQKCALHPTQKPVELLKWGIKSYTDPGDTVLDFCFGSGSTGVACVETGRNFIGIEIDPDKFQIGSQRIEEAKSQWLMNLLK